MSGKKQNEKTLWRDWFTCDILLGIALELIVLLVSILYWHMQFPKLTVAKAPVLNALYLVLALPLLIGVLGFSARSVGDRFWSRLFTPLACPAFVLGILSAIVLCLIPPYCSGTSSEKQYLRMDQGVDRKMSEDIRTLFPESILPTASDPSYQYYKYTSVLENSLHLTLGETLSENSFQLEVDRIKTLPMLTSGTRTESDGITLIDYVTEDGLILHITLDEVYHRIIYAASYRQTNA